MRGLDLDFLVKRLNLEWDALGGDPILPHAVERRHHTAFAVKCTIGKPDEPPIRTRGIG